LTAPFPEGSGHTGEHLVAIAFEGDAGEMHIGTQDEDALAERAGDGTLPDRWWRDPPDGPWFATVEEAMAAAPPPDEWTKRWYESHGPVAWWREFRMLLSDIKDIIHPPPPSYPMDTFAVEIHRDGVTVSLPPLIPGDRGELQFLVAWTMPRDEHDASASYAVDQDPGEILSQAGCT
jgi:hypothetical protein